MEASYSSMLVTFLIDRCTDSTQHYPFSFSSLPLPSHPSSALDLFFRFFFFFVFFFFSLLLPLRLRLAYLLRPSPSRWFADVDRVGEKRKRFTRGDFDAEEERREEKIEAARREQEEGPRDEATGERELESGLRVVHCEAGIFLSLAY